MNWFKKKPKRLLWVLNLTESIDLNESPKEIEKQCRKVCEKCQTKDCGNNCVVKKLLDGEKIESQSRKVNQV